MKKLLPSIFVSVIVLSACTAKPAKPTEEVADTTPDQVVSEQSERVIRETKNVSYSGTVKPLGISIYMEGTHRLSLSDGRFILLESDAIDLNGYVAEEVDVLGAIRPTVESDAMIMRVESISLIEREEQSDAPSDEESSSSASSEESTETPEDPVVKSSSVANTEPPPSEEPEAAQASPQRYRKPYNPNK